MLVFFSAAVYIWNCCSSLQQDWESVSSCMVQLARLARLARLALVVWCPTHPQSNRISSVRGWACAVVIPVQTRADRPRRGLGSAVQRLPPRDKDPPVHVCFMQSLHLSSAGYLTPFVSTHPFHLDSTLQVLVSIYAPLKPAGNPPEQAVLFPSSEITIIQQLICSVLSCQDNYVHALMENRNS